MYDYSKLLPHCTGPAQERLVRALMHHGTVNAAIASIDGDERTHHRRLATLKARAASEGYAPGHWEDGTAAGYGMAKVTIQRGADGNIERTWERQTPLEKQKALEGFAEALAAQITPAKPKPLPKIKKHDPDLMTAIVIGDAHIGMRAYGKETKHADFDTDIATEQLRNAFDYLIERAEPTETGLLVDVGDFMHANGQQNTTYSGTPLDVDTRHYRAMKEAGMVMRYAVDRMLAKFKKVVVVVARGNHNTDAAPAVQLMLDFYYSKEKRVTILPTEGFYHYIEYGSWLLGITHGDKQKPESLASSMARDMAKAWGRTTHRMWMCGHFHKENVKTLPGVKVKVFAALPPPDSWHASHGYAGDGEMEMLTFRKGGGLHSSHVYNIPQPRVEPDVRIA